MSDNADELRITPPGNNPTGEYALADVTGTRTLPKNYRDIRWIATAYNHTTRIPNREYLHTAAQAYRLGLGAAASMEAVYDQHGPKLDGPVDYAFAVVHVTPDGYRHVGTITPKVVDADLPAMFRSREYAWVTAEHVDGCRAARAVTTLFRNKALNLTTAHVEKLHEITGLLFSHFLNHDHTMHNHYVGKFEGFGSQPVTRYTHKHD